MAIWQPELLNPQGQPIELAPNSMLETCVAHHRHHFNKEPKGAATAPSTWSMIGEHTDYAGGVVLSTMSNWATAVAVGPNSEKTINVVLIGAQGNVEKHSISTAEVNARAQAQLLTHDNLGRAVTPPLPEGGIAARLGGIAWTMIHKQMLSRDTKGLNITALSSIPNGVGLGEFAALDIALALALFQEEIDEAPVRARIADICSHAAFMFSESTALRARHTTALRGESGKMSVIDYSDGSVTQAPHPVSRTAGLQAYLVAAPHDHKLDVALHTHRRHAFIDEASRAFSTESLRRLPDAATRVVDWLQAVLEVTGRQDLPTVEQAGHWLRFWEAETQRAQQTSSALRSRRLPQLAALLATSQRELDEVYGISTPDSALAQLCMERGAFSARCSSAGVSKGIIALIDEKRGGNFAADLAADGLTVIPLGHGETAAQA
ncbi:galactokinase family protein [Corynebacterium callunae]|uniref:Galactokinase n=1 Tax=Corynebacterium callunae DSM 20147 TaxID=1121353 RepID=M1UGC7_9CORY|nr:galactokinase family protein [Corynebacterium callunae]AGG67320.1 Galactokinase [Corynebacterium callunae DSM 20147]